MELKDYTDEELRSEIRRRANEKRKARRVNVKKEPYIYTQAVVKRFERFKGETIFEGVFEFGSDRRDDLYHAYFEYIDCAKLARNCGFNKSNMPQVGDLVRLRKRNYTDEEKVNCGRWQICEILKRN